MIYHIGAHNADNAGDIVINDVMKRILYNFDEIIMQVDDWRETTRDYNHGKAVIVGGGGLFIPDTKPNLNSGWRWNITARQMEKIKVPIIVYSVGFNKFRNQDHFQLIFSESVRTLVNISSFFGLREKAGRHRLITYIGECADFMNWQPCPAQFGSFLYPEIEPKRKEKTLVFAPAMDRMHLRGDVYHIMPALRYAVDNGWKIILATHIACDKEVLPLMDRIPYTFMDLRGRPANEILQFYADASLVIGMRLHSLLIPFGFSVPIIPVISHDKIVDWLEDIGHPEWGVELQDVSLVDKLIQRIDQHETDPLARSRLWKITQDNLIRIKDIING